MYFRYRDSRFHKRGSLRQLACCAENSVFLQFVWLSLCLLLKSNQWRIDSYEEIIQSTDVFATWQQVSRAKEGLNRV